MFRNTVTTACLLLVLALLQGCAHLQTVEQGELKLVSVKKIWDQGEHNAFTDLIRFKGKWYCTFRESAAHVGGDGKIRILVSEDGESWESTGLLTDAGIDLRDPKFSITPDKQLMVSMGGSHYDGTTLLGRRPRTAFSKDGKTWSEPIEILDEGDWLWRVTWHKGKAYGVSYRIPKDQWELELFESKDGLIFNSLKKFDIPGRPNETTLRFLDDDTMVAMVRREAESKNVYIGTSQPPYTDWNFKESSHQVGGPNFIVLPGGNMIGGGRNYQPKVSTMIGWMNTEDYTPSLQFPSGGDTSYPGFVWHKNQLWVSYYASHEGKTSIYLAKVEIEN